jgi:hypothetical protein
VNEGVPLLTVTGASGGAGATTVALHLALALRRRRPCLVDLAGGLAERLGFAADRSHWGRSLEPLPFPGGLAVLAAPRPFVPPDDPGGLVAAAPGGVVLADVAPELLAGLPVPQRLIVVVARSRPGAERARALLDALAPRVPVVAVTIRRPPAGGATRAEVERILGLRLAADLPYCPAMAEAEQAGRAETKPWSRWWWGVGALARRLEVEAHG